MPSCISFSIRYSYEYPLICQPEIKEEYSGNFSIPLNEKLESDACFEKDELSVKPLKEHLFTI